MHIRQSEKAVWLDVGQAFVVNAQQAQHRGVEIVNGNAAFDGVAADVSRL